MHILGNGIEDSHKHILLQSSSKIFFIGYERVLSKSEFANKIDVRNIISFDEEHGTEIEIMVSDGELESLIIPSSKLTFWNSSELSKFDILSKKMMQCRAKLYLLLTCIFVIKPERYEIKKALHIMDIERDKAYEYRRDKFDDYKLVCNIEVNKNWPRYAHTSVIVDLIGIVRKKDYNSHYILEGDADDIGWLQSIIEEGYTLVYNDYDVIKFGTTDISKSYHESTGFIRFGFDFKGRFETSTYSSLWCFPDVAFMDFHDSLLAAVHKHKSNNLKVYRISPSVVYKRANNTDLPDLSLIHVSPIYALYSTSDRNFRKGFYILMSDRVEEAYYGSYYVLVLFSGKIDKTYKYILTLSDERMQEFIWEEIINSASLAKFDERRDRWFYVSVEIHEDEIRMMPILSYPIN